MPLNKVIMARIENVLVLSDQELLVKIKENPDYLGIVYKRCKANCLGFMRKMTSGKISHKFRQPSIEYHRYILDLPPGLVLAHLYTWHMGDLYGGQMIKKIIKAPHRSLDFNDAENLKTIIRSKLDDSLGDEANRAFDWAIKIMESYEKDMGQNS